jgi:predicted nucleotidyltransferase
MVAATTVDTVRHYLDVVSKAGIPVVAGVVYGSFARGEENKDSDIDVLVISPAFDGKKDSRVGRRAGS